jgi:hypothetical protein
VSEGGAPTGGVAIACTLDESGLAGRMEEWLRFYRSFVQRTEVECSAVRLVLIDADEVLLHAASLSRREKECCAFFEFALELGAEEVSLLISVPPEAEPVLAEFVRALAAT